MNNISKPIIKTLFPGDPRVRVLPGDQAKPEQTQRLRPCVYTAFHYTDGRYPVFHMLTRQVLPVTKKGMSQPKALGHFLLYI